MKRLNTSPKDLELNKLIYNFKVYYNQIKIGERIPNLFNRNLYGKNCLFDLWLRSVGIMDLDVHLIKIEKEFNILNHYKRFEIRSYVIVNR